jgi:hypothetical protein
MENIPCHTCKVRPARLLASQYYDIAFGNDRRRRKNMSAKQKVSQSFPGLPTVLVRPFFSPSPNVTLQRFSQIAALEEVLFDY